MKIRGINSNIQRKKPMEPKKKKRLSRSQYWRMIFDNPDFHSTHYPDRKAKRKQYDI